MDKLLYLQKDILLAEDDPDDVEIFEMALEALKLPYPISHAGNGEELLIRLKEKLPSILFLDIGMPCNDGIACIEDIRENREYRSEEHTSELQSLMRTSYAVFCWNKINKSLVHHVCETT